MPELEATGTREPRACTYIRRWMWFLAHAANEPIPEFARIDIFNVTQEVRPPFSYSCLLQKTAYHILCCCRQIFIRCMLIGFRARV